MSEELVVVGEADLTWETWSDEQAGRGGNVHWKTLLSSDVTSSSTMTLGILRVPVSEALEEHRHAQAEIYFILQGRGLVTVGSESRDVETGSAVFIPGDTPHSCRNTGSVELRFAYVFPTDSFAEITYVFD